MTRHLDWISRHDPRSRAFAARKLMGTAPPRVKTVWPPGRVLDQGAEGACVAFGWVGEALAEPVPVDFGPLELPNGWSNDPQALAFQLYQWCRDHDEFPAGTEGTSVLQGAKAMLLLGLITEYRWAFGIDDVIDALCTLGPVVLGIPWFSDSYEAPGGEMRATGQQVGGHCILAVGFDPNHVFRDGTTGPAVLLLNSWGPGWGEQGLAWIRAEELGRLLDQRGEACVPLVRSYGRTKVTVMSQTLWRRAVGVLRTLTRS